MTTGTEVTIQSSKRPTHIAYSVKDRENKKGDWRPLGVAFAHGDGKGFNVLLDLLPLDGRITLRAAQDEKRD